MTDLLSYRVPTEVDEICDLMCALPSRPPDMKDNLIYRYRVEQYRRVVVKRAEDNIRQFLEERGFRIPVKDQELLTQIADLLGTKFEHDNAIAER